MGEGLGVKACLSVVLASLVQNAGHNEHEEDTTNTKNLLNERRALCVFFVSFVTCICTSEASIPQLLLAF